MEKLNGCIFLLKVMTYYRNIILFENKVSSDIKKEYDSKSVYNKSSLKTKRKSYVD